MIWRQLDDYSENPQALLDIRHYSETVSDIILIFFRSETFWHWYMILVPFYNFSYISRHYSASFRDAFWAEIGPDMILEHVEKSFWGTLETLSWNLLGHHRKYFGTVFWVCHAARTPRFSSLRFVAMTLFRAFEFRGERSLLTVVWKCFASSLQTCFKHL